MINGPGKPGFGPPSYGLLPGRVAPGRVVPVRDRPGERTTTTTESETTMTEATVFTLPDADALANALVSVSGSGYTVKTLYPRILRSAGEKITPVGFAMLWILAINDHGWDGGDIPGPLRARLPEYIRAIIPDPVLRAEVTDVFLSMGLIDTD